MRPGKAVNYKVADLYQKQKGRGQKGFGYFAPSENKFVHHTDESGILKRLRRESTVQEILFHHRMPTSTPNVYNACHPFSTRGAMGNVLENQYVGVHNGVITNPSGLKVKHEGLGVKYVSEQPNAGLTFQKFNDSEALIWELALFLEGKIPSFEAIGNMAWILMELDAEGKQRKLYFGRNQNPLKINRKRGKFLTLSSEGPGEMAEANTLYCYDYATGDLSKKPMTFEQYYSQNRGSAFNRQSGVKEHGYAENHPPTAGQKFIGQANHTYTNGRYDAEGVWHPKVESTVTKANDVKVLPSGEEYKSPLTLAQQSEIAALIPPNNIAAYSQKILALVEFDQDKALEMLKQRREAKAAELIEARKHFGYWGPLYISEDSFEDQDEKLFGAEIDLYMLEMGFTKINSLSSADLVEEYMNSEMGKVQA